MDSVDICPTEDALSILLEYLVDPILPSKSSARSMPSESDQESVAKQVHAVVLLYNYYYRKQHPHLECLDFERFCKLAIIRRPTLLAHMKLMLLSNDTELEDPEKQLSLVENKIMDAYDISTTLDALQNAPSTEGWPICKVAVFLINSRMENCLLNYGSATKGVWSVIEKDVDLSYINLNGAMDSEHVNKKKIFIRKPLRNESGADEAVIQQSAFSAVKETTGISQSDLLVLEKHVVCSTSRVKTAACFYIMQCTQPKSDHLIQNSIKDVINSLQGPMFVRSSNQWMHTSVVEYFHMLPYAGILSNWASKNGPSSRLQVQRVGSETVNLNSFERTEKPCAAEFPRISCRHHLGSTKETGSTKQNENDECYVIESSDNDNGFHKMEIDDSSVIRAKTTESKVLTDNYQKQKTPIDGCSNGSWDKAKMADSLKRQRISQGGGIARGNKDCNNTSSDKDWVSESDHTMVQYHQNSNDLDKVYAIIASKDQQLSQAALKVILSKRAKLCLQQRDIEDQIIQCDKNIQTILKGGEGDLALKIESLIEACNDVSLRILNQETTYKDTKYPPSTQLVRYERSSASVRNMQNPIQELDDLCCRNNWILPTYRLSAQDGGFRATVAVKGVDFEYSSSGELRPLPREARASAATQMLVKLCNVPDIVLSE